MKISLIIPAYNAESSIVRCLDSVCKQDFPDWECIVIDDGSKDATATIVAEMATVEKRIRLLKNGENRGVSASRNRGLEAARGEYISFLDSDDWLNPGFFRYCIGLLEQGGCDWVKTFLRNHRADGLRVAWGFKPRERMTSGWRLKEAFQDLAHDFGHCTGQMVRKRLLSGMRFQEGLSLAEDQLFSMELLCRNTRLYVSGEYFYNYQRRNDRESLSKKGLLRLEDAIAYLNGLQQMLDRYDLPEEMHRRLASYSTTVLDRHYSKDRTDAVVCYVDGEDPSWLGEYRRLACQIGTPSREDGHFSARFHQDGTLRFVLRSMDAGLPFLKGKGGLIHLVVSGDTQVPDWIDRSRVHIVRHKDFIPPKYLPLFNSSSIELFLHDIPGLAEHFVYFNDDMFVTAPVGTEDLFEDGKPRVKFLKSPVTDENRDKAWLRSFVNAYALGVKPHPFSGRDFYLHPPHTALPMARSVGKALWRQHGSELRASITPFRDRRNINQYVFASYGLTHGMYSPRMKVRHAYINDRATDIAARLETMMREGVQFLCINGVPDSPEENKKAVRKWLERMFPEPSRYEKEDAR